MTLDLDRPISLHGRRILVTGGSSGFGRAATLAFLREGARVATCAREELGLTEARLAGALGIAADVSDPVAVTRLVDAVAEEFGGLDAVVNNAAVLSRERLEEQSVDSFSRTLRINLMGPWLVTRQALRIMERGSIVMITSGLAWAPMRPYNAYAASKAGLNMLTRAFAQELGGRFRVNALDPGTGRTRMNPHAENPPEGIVAALRALVSLEADGPTGRCFRKNGRETPWEAPFERLLSV